MSTWRGMLAPLDVSTGDGRRFLSSGVTSRELPLPLKWQREDTEGHDKSVVVGSLERVDFGTVAEAITAGWIDAKCVESKLADDLLAVWGTGQMFDDVSPHEMPRLSEDVAEAIHLLKRKVIGPSVDAGSYEAAIAVSGSSEPLTDQQLDDLFWGNDAGDEVELELLFTEYQIAAATLVPIPAFAECRPFEIISEDALTAAVRNTGWSDIPLADRDMEWDGTEAERRVADDAGIGGDNPDWGRYAESFLYRDDDADPETKGAYGFQIVDYVGGSRQIVPRGVFAVANALSGGRGGTTIPQADQDAMKGVVEDLYARMAEAFEDDTIVAPWAEETASTITASETNALLAAVTASSAATMVDPALFDDPRLKRLTPITVTEDGRVFGHVATHDVCHVGMPGVCTTAPVDDDGYRMFHRYQPDGIPVMVGRITTGGGNFRCTCRQCSGRNDDHACLKLSMGGTISHHDRMATVAWVRAGEDTTLNAVWVAGVVNPGATVEDLAGIYRQKLSGDWRPVGSEVKLVEVLALSREEPGFPLPHFRVSAGQVAALTAAGVVLPDMTIDYETIDYERLASLLAVRLADRLKADPGPDHDPNMAKADPGPDHDPNMATADTTNASDVDAVVGLIDEVNMAVDGGRVTRLLEELREVF